MSVLGPTNVSTTRLPGADEGTLPKARATGLAVGAAAAVAATTGSLTKVSAKDKAFMALVVGGLGFAAGNMIENGVRLADNVLPGGTWTVHASIAGTAAAIAGVAALRGASGQYVRTAATLGCGIVATGAAVNYTGLTAPGRAVRDAVPDVGWLPVAGVAGVAAAAAGFGVYRAVGRTMKAARLSADALRNARPDLPNTLIKRETLDAAAFKFIDRMPEYAHFKVRPERIYAGLRSAPTPRARVEVALDEWQRRGGLERAHALVVVPTGSGWTNHVPVEAMERMAGGDVATLAVQYADVPSFMAFGKVPIAAETFDLLVAGLRQRIKAAHPNGGGPKVTLVGESLGANIGQKLFPTIEDLDKAGIDHVIWTGQTAWSKWNTNGSGGKMLRTFSLDDVREARAKGAPLRVVSFSNPDDPVAWFAPAMAYDDAARAAAMSGDKHWLPVVSWMQTGLVDMKNALAHRKIGKLMSKHHDYRGAYPPLVRDVVGFDRVDDAELSRIISAIERNEVAFDKQFKAGF